MNELELENDDLKRRNADLNNDNRYLRRTRDTIRTDLANERALREAITEKGTDITRRMTQRTSRSITANFGSMAAEAVPYVGIAAIVGVTFYEVRDACLTMSDMRELSDMFGTPSSNENRYCGFTLQEFKDQVFNTSSKVDCSNLDMPSEMVEECGKPPAIQRELPEDEPGDALLRPQKP
ncbi:hypothetical protein SAMN05444339_12216 [Loktanella atrilutea]|uniref:Uncharacterized protein n=1 Tax=Loktanella atrilutea TaxID=366533 RepID=A0A1M5FLS0_LOKAT|nr:hypothetical protein SAMN05444339_12216 [Loktanella atrilutea]